MIYVQQLNTYTHCACHVMYTQTCNKCLYVCSRDERFNNNTTSTDVINTYLYRSTEIYIFAQYVMIDDKETDILVLKILQYQLS